MSTEALYSRLERLVIFAAVWAVISLSWFIREVSTRRAEEIKELRHRIERLEAAKPDPMYGLEAGLPEDNFGGLTEFKEMRYD